MRLPIFLLLVFIAPLLAEGPAPLAGTQPLTTQGDLSAQMVEGIDRWLMRETERVAEARHLDVSTPEGQEKGRARLRHRLGMEDPEPGPAEKSLQLNDAPYESPDHRWTATPIQWPVYADVWGRGILLKPAKEIRASIVVVPHAGDLADESFSSATGKVALKLVEQGCLVLYPLTTDRGVRLSENERIGKFTNLDHREWLYRPAFEVGRTLLGYEAATLIAGMHAVEQGHPIGILGCGDGGMLALYTAALEPRFDAVAISGYFGPREHLWEEHIDHNVVGLLRDFGDAELAALIAPRPMVIENIPMEDTWTAKDIPVTAKPAPGRTRNPTEAEVSAEVDRARQLRQQVAKAAPITIISPDLSVGPGGDPTLQAFLQTLGVKWKKPAQKVRPEAPATRGPGLDWSGRSIRELEAHTQRVLRECERIRYQLPLWTKLKPGPEWEAVQRAARADFWENVIGKLPTDYLPPNPRTRQIYDREKWRGYDVMLDVHPDIFAWGILLVPKDLKPGERRPVVVCQHGLEGLPEDTINEDPKSRAFGPYQGFAARLADRGFIVYAPHNPYRGGDKFRVLQRKANPLGLTLFSFIIAQHDVTTRWLASLPFVDPERIAFYGLSYGGKTAMRVPAVLDRYCLSICSGDFNEWVLKCATTEHAFGYVFSNEYEIFEWDLGHRFNYAEMALLIAPRPFMVERGHNDGVAVDEWVGYEYAKVRRAYDQLGLGERTEIEWFNGPHTIHGVGTFQFLHHWLRWPE